MVTIKAIVTLPDGKVTTVELTAKDFIDGMDKIEKMAIVVKGKIKKIRGENNG